MLLSGPVPPGELPDKPTILEIKSERMDDAAKLENVRRELKLLRETWGASPFSARDVATLVAELKVVNARLWDIEDRLREHERARRFDTAFVELARSVYLENDRRAAIKRELNERLGSELREEKSYRPY